MEHLGWPLPVVALAALLMTTACAARTQAQTTTQSQGSTAPSATTPSQPAGRASDASPAATPADVVSGDILDEIALTRAAIQTRRQAIVTAAMDLTAPESQAFWPIYRDYRTDMAKVDDRLVDLIIVYAGNYKSLNDDMANKLLKEYLDIERDRITVKNQYVPRFLGAIPAVKVARFYQVDNKLDKKIQAELAEEIPLAR